MTDSEPILWPTNPWPLYGDHTLAYPRTEVAVR
jgi:hypothetical protein